jgi:hypothetical protein
MAGLINLRLLTDFFNKIGQKATSDDLPILNEGCRRARRYDAANAR